MELHQQQQGAFESSDNLVVVVSYQLEDVLNVDFPKLFVVERDMSVHRRQTVLKHTVVLTFALKPTMVVHFIHDQVNLLFIKGVVRSNCKWTFVTIFAWLDKRTTANQQRYSVCKEDEWGLSCVEDVYSFFARDLCICIHQGVRF